MKTLESVNKLDWVSRGLPLLPQWLYDLTSEKEEIRVAAYETLESVLLGDNFLERPPLGRIFGSDVPVLVAPFLIGLLQQKYTAKTDEIVPNEYLILLLLNGLAEYALQGLSQVESKHILYQRSKRIENIICENVNLFISLLDHPSDKVKCVVAHTLIVCHTEVSLVLKAFLECFHENGHQEFMRAMLSTISYFSDSIPSDMKNMTTQILLPFAQLNRSPKIRAWATLCLVQVSKADSSQEIVDLLLDVMLTQSEFHIRHPLEAIRGLGARRGQAAILNFLEHSVPGNFVCYGLIALLDLVFEQNVLADYEIEQRKYSVHDFLRPAYIAPSNVMPFLSQERCSILQRLLNIDTVWGLDCNVFEFYHLPNSRSKLQSLVESCGKV